jgi:hypothetical protein
MSQEVQDFLAKGGKITVLPEGKVKAGLNFPKMGHKYSEYNVGRQRVLARLDASKRAA